MKITLMLACLLFLLSCAKKDDVSCMCYGSNNQEDMYDLGIKYKPSAKDFLAQCDTLALYNGLDSCQIWMRGH